MREKAEGEGDDVLSGMIDGGWRRVRVKGRENVSNGFGKLFWQRAAMLL